MKLITKRLCRLEKRVANHEIGKPSAAEILRERRRRRAQVSGLPYGEHQPDPALYADGRRPTWAEILRSARALRRVNAEAERAATPERDTLNIRTPQSVYRRMERLETRLARPRASH
jgi:hypothetical protein